MFIFNQTLNIKELKNLTDGTLILTNYNNVVESDYDYTCDDWDDLTDKERDEINEIGFVGAYTTIELHIYHTNSKSFQRVAEFEGSSLYGIQADCADAILEYLSESKSNLLNILSKIGVSQEVLDQIEEQATDDIKYK